MSNKFDFIILSTIQKEIMAGKKVFNKYFVCENELIPQSQQIFFKCGCQEMKVFNNLSKKYSRGIFAFLPEGMGNTDAAIVATALIKEYEPKMVFLFGISAGIRGVSKKGDVIIPAKIHDVTIKVHAKGGYEQRITAYERPQIISRMLKENVYNPDKIIAECDRQTVKEKKAVENISQKKLKEKETAVNMPLKESLEENILILSKKMAILTGSISSDNVLIKDPEYYEKTKNVDQQYQGADMESAGLVRACRFFNNLPWLVVRAVSDYGDVQKDDIFHELSAKRAAIVLMHYLTNSINFEKLPENNTLHPLEQYIKRCYENGDFYTVCDIGTNINSCIRYAGLYDIGIRVNEYVEKSASRIGDKETRAEALCNLGRLYHLKGDDTRAETIIYDSLRIAKEIKNYYLITKCHRQLSSMFRKQNNFEESKKHNSSAKAFVKKIQDENKKKDLMNCILFSEAKILFYCSKYKESLKKFIQAQLNFELAGDKRRKVQACFFVGKVLKELSETAEFIAKFRETFKDSYDIKMYDIIEGSAKELVESEFVSIDEKKDYVRKAIKYCKEKYLCRTEIEKWEAILVSLS